MKHFDKYWHYGLQSLKKERRSVFTMILSLSVFMALFLLMVSMNHVMVQTFTAEQVNLYGDVDYVVTFDENSVSRIINKRDFEETFPQIRFSSIFFNFYQNISYKDDIAFVEVLSSSTYELERLISSSLPFLQNDDMLITSSFAQSHGLSVGDDVSFSVGNTTLSYSVKAIVEDEAIFQGDKVFVLKTPVMEELYQLGSLENLGNNLYIIVHDDIDKDAFTNLLAEEDLSSGYLVLEAIDQSEISRQANYNSTLFFGVGLMMVVALVLVIHSLFNLFYRSYPKELGVIRSLGGNSLFLNKIWWMKGIVMWLISSVLGMFIGWILMNVAALLYGVSVLITFSIWNFLISSGILLFFLFFENALLAHKQGRLSAVQNSLFVQKTTHYGRIVLTYVVLAAVLFGLSFVFASVGERALLWTLASIFALFAFFDLLLHFWQKVANQMKKKSLFTMYSLRNMDQNPFVHQTFRVMFAIFLVFISVFSVNSFIKNETEIVKSQVHADVAITGIFDYDESLIDEVEQNFDVTQVVEGLAYQNTLVHIGDEIKRVRFSLSLTSSDFLDMFEFYPIDDSDFSYPGDLPFVFLPVSYLSAYHVAKGDIVQLDLTSTLRQVDFVVAGFLDTNFDNIIYTNFIEYASGYGEQSVNTLFLRVGSTFSFSDLVSKYSPKMYFLIDMDAFIQDFIDYIASVESMFQFLCAVMIVSFIVVLFNNFSLVFSSTRFMSSKMQILGLTKKQFAKLSFLEAGAIFLVVLIGILPETALLIRLFPQMMTLFRYYKEIAPTWTDLLLTSCLIFGIVILSYMIEMIRTSAMNLVEESIK